MSTTDVFIVIPAYNEAKRLGSVLVELTKSYPNIVVVDDGSTDDTFAVARQHTQMALHHAVNRGQGAALQTGIKYCLSRGAQFIVTFDADGQHQVSDVAAMLEPVMAGEVQVALGSRFMDRQSNVPRLRRLLLHAARVFTWATSGLHLSDCHNGFRAIARDAAEQIELRQDRMAHASEFYDQIKILGLSFREVPVSITYTAETLAKGQSLFNSLNILIHYLLGKVPR
jgi:glycosyltransferase involved in cell wall biosynthesis